MLSVRKSLGWHTKMRKFAEQLVRKEIWRGIIGFKSKTEIGSPYCKWPDQQLKTCLCLCKCWNVKRSILRQTNYLSEYKFTSISKFNSYDKIDNYSLQYRVKFSFFSVFTLKTQGSKFSWFQNLKGHTSGSSWLPSFCTSLKKVRSAICRCPFAPCHINL